MSAPSNGVLLSQNAVPGEGGQDGKLRRCGPKVGVEQMEGWRVEQG